MLTLWTVVRIGNNTREAPWMVLQCISHLCAGYSIWNFIHFVCTHHSKAKVGTIDTVSSEIRKLSLRKSK